MKLLGYERPIAGSVWKLRQHANCMAAAEANDAHMKGKAVSSDSGSTALSYYPGTSILRKAVTTAGENVVRRETRVMDAAGRIIGMHTSAGPNDSLTTLTATGYVVDELGCRTSARREDGSAWIYGYNDRSEVTSGSKHLPGTSTPLAAGQQFNYTYDDIGNRLTALSGGNASGANQRQTSYTVNDLNQYGTIQNPRTLDVLVRSADTPTVTSTGNQVTVIDQGTYNRAEITIPEQNAAPAQWLPVNVSIGENNLSSGHLWMPAASVSLSYDADGNLLNDGRWTYTWDGENRLVSMFPTSAAATVGVPNIELDFRYDHRSRRIVKQVKDLNTSSAPVISDLRFAYDGWNMVAEFDASGESLSLTRSYTWGPDLSNTLQGAGGVGGLLAARSGTSDFYPCFDGNGNVIAWSDSLRQVRRRFDFDPFGNVTITENTAATMPDIPLGFSTKYTDTETGLVYYIGRYYIPPLGRWPSMDPTEEEGGLNLYGFVGNDGINFSDFLGLDPNARPQAEPQARQGNQSEIDDVAKSLESKCSDKCIGRCSTCTKDNCKSEARKIAEAYVKRVHQIRREGENDRDQHFGWLCYEWAGLVMRDLSKLKLECWNIKQVGFVQMEIENGRQKPVLKHNYLYASVGASMLDGQSPIQDCGKVLDPWTEGLPKTYDPIVSYQWNYIHNPSDDTGTYWSNGKWHPYRFPGPWTPSESKVNPDSSNK